MHAAVRYGASHVFSLSDLSTWCLAELPAEERKRKGGQRDEEGGGGSF